jgi:MoxR-like ATPase
VDAEAVARKCTQISDSVETVIVGKRATVRLALAGLLARGHILIEDIPGVGKTMLAKSIARSIGGTYKRIQFTPDLLPADVTGVSVFNQKTGEFEFRAGPIFANVVLADELNRATPKAQSSLLECMEEHQVTVDGITRPLDRPFFVMATENPIEYRGTYPLPEAQLDRFLMRLSMGYPKSAEEVEILERQVFKHPIFDVTPVVSMEEVVWLQEEIKSVFIEDSMKAYMVEIVNATRDHALVQLGASPRGSIALMRCGQALAAMEGRDYLIPDDIKGVAEVILAHRLILKPEARLQKVSSSDVVKEILNSAPVPVVGPGRR